MKICFIVDDSEVDIFILNRALRSIGLSGEVCTYRHGKEAFDAVMERINAGEQLPDIILLDVNMPVWDGWDFLEALKTVTVEKPPHVYVMSSSHEPEDMERALSYPLVDDYLRKPVSPDALKGMIAGV
ncbi:MAG: response regulator [Flavobacteriales bacterium]